MEAIYNLGLIFADGKIGVPQNIKRAVELMTEAATLRSTIAPIWLGNRQWNQEYDIKIQDYLQAEAWYKYAIDIGDADCGPSGLAAVYTNGFGSKASNYAEAIRLADISINTKGTCAEFAKTVKAAAQSKLKTAAPKPAPAAPKKP